MNSTPVPSRVKAVLHSLMFYVWIWRYVNQRAKYDLVRMHFHSVWMSFPTFCSGLNIHYWYFKITFYCFTHQTVIFFWRHARNLQTTASVSWTVLLERSTSKKHTWQFPILTSNIPTNHYVLKAAQVRNGFFCFAEHLTLPWYHMTSTCNIKIWYQHHFMSSLCLC